MHTRVRFLLSHLSMPVSFALSVQQAPFTLTTTCAVPPGAVLYGRPEKPNVAARRSVYEGGFSIKHVLTRQFTKTSVLCTVSS